MDAVLERAADHSRENTRINSDLAQEASNHTVDDKKHGVFTVLDRVSTNTSNATKYAAFVGTSNNTEKRTAGVALKTPEKVRQLSGVSNASCDSLCAEFPSLSGVLSSISSEPRPSSPPTFTSVASTSSSHYSNIPSSSSTHNCSSSSPPPSGRICK